MVVYVCSDVEKLRLPLVVRNGCRLINMPAYCIVPADSHNHCCAHSSEAKTYLKLIFTFVIHSKEFLISKQYWKKACSYRATKDAAAVSNYNVNNVNNTNVNKLIIIKNIKMMNAFTASPTLASPVRTINREHTPVRPSLPSIALIHD